MNTHARTHLHNPSTQTHTSMHIHAHSHTHNNNNNIRPGQPEATQTFAQGPASDSVACTAVDQDTTLLPQTLLLQQSCGKAVVFNSSDMRSLGCSPRCGAGDQHLKHHLHPFGPHRPRRVQLLRVHDKPRHVAPPSGLYLHAAELSKWYLRPCLAFTSNISWLSLGVISTLPLMKGTPDNWNSQ
jgi:hypothetical protein